jgi:hypothetical protein
MIVTCYIGWWYQRHWRHQFNSAVKALLEPKQGSIHDPKPGHGGAASPKLTSQTEEQKRIPRKSVPGADMPKGADTDEEITALPASKQGENDHGVSKNEHMAFDDFGDG